jgi:oxygen-dependent protoporphyrinogen oxidase
MSGAAPQVDAVVVGAGIAGLAAALELQSAGGEVTVIDPADRPGGVMRTDHAGGYVVERGPNTAQVKAPMRAFLAQRGFEGALVRAQPASRLRFVYRAGKLVPVPLSPLAFATTPLLSLRAKLRVLAEPLIRRNRGGEETVAELVGRRLGREVVSGLVGPFLTGVYAGDETQLGARAVFPGLVRHDERFGSLALGALAGVLAGAGRGGLAGSWSAPAGLGPFARQLADRLAEPPALGSRVVAIARDGARFRVEVTSVSGDVSLDAARVVVAAPAPEAAPLLRGVDAEAAQAVAGVRYAPIATVPLGVRRDDVRAPIRGFGFLVPREEGLALLGCLFMSQLFSGRAPEGHELLHCMLGGVRWPEAADAPEAALVERALHDLDRTLGLKAAPESLGVGRYARAIPQPDRDHARRMRGVEERLASAAPGLVLAGSYVAGVSVADTLASGIAAAGRLIGQTPARAMDAARA